MISLFLILAASLMAAFVSWYLCGLVSGEKTRGIIRATSIALLCSPGIVIGHGFAIVPSLFALAVQPSIFTLGPMIVVFIIALILIFSIPVLRNHTITWPPTAEEVFLSAYPIKFVFFGLIAMLLMWALLYINDYRGWKVITLQYALFFSGAGANMTMCYWATHMKQAPPFLIPFAFSVPALLTASPIVPLVWYTGGAIGSLAGSGRRRSAAWVAIGIFSLLFANALFRTYSAATAPSHVTIQGGVSGNLAMATLYVFVIILVRWILKNRMGKQQ